MSLSRSPSPRPGGGWSSPGLISPDFSDKTNSSRTSSSKSYGGLNGGAPSVTWAAAKAKSEQVNGYPGFSTRGAEGGGFIERHIRRLSNSLPRYNIRGSSNHYDAKEKLGRGRYGLAGAGRLGRARNFVAFYLRRVRLRFLVIFGLLLTILLFYVTPLHYYYRRVSFLGGGKKFVLIVGSNEGGGVMEWKGAKEWAIERLSMANKRDYAKTWGYELSVADMSTKRRYSHEWRESWEKVDVIRAAMRQYPKAEWFWWLDLHTFIMEPSISLQSHIFNHITRTTYRDINLYNPLHIAHPRNDTYLDDISTSPTGDGKAESINLIVPQDCGGFNLGSFLIKRSEWTDRLLDIWWDPVGYEQKHMEWEHKEQDALEYLYQNQPWIRTGTAFIPQRKINSFPPGACADNGIDPRIHYNETNRDFVVNMAGCEWGRDCWTELYNYRELSRKLNRTAWAKFKDYFKKERKPVKS